MSAVFFTAAMADVPLEQCGKIEQHEKSPIDPFDGMILLKSDILKNIRLYGFYASDKVEIKEAFPPHPAFTKKDKTYFLKNNVPLEPIGALAQYLFPSVDGAILTQNERKNDFFGFIARIRKSEKTGVDFINGLLIKLLGTDGPLSQTVLNGEEMLDEENLQTILNTWVKDVSEKAIALEEKIDAKTLEQVKTLLLEALKTSVTSHDKKQDAPYPDHVALHLLVAFAFRISDSAEEFAKLDAVVQLKKDAPLFSPKAYNAGVEAFKNKLQQKNSAAVSAKEIFLFSQGYEAYKAIVPSLVPYQITTYTPPSKHGKSSVPIGYADCGETSLLNFFRIVLGKEGMFSSDYVRALEKKLEISEGQEHTAHKTWLGFLTKNVDFFQAFTASGHAAWSQLVSNLNELSGERDNKITYLRGKNTCEMNAGVVNMLSVIEKLIPHPDLTVKWAETPEKLKKAMDGKDKLTEEEKKDLESVLTQAENKLTRLCELFSREGFQLDWSCQGKKALPAITGVDVQFIINKDQAFVWRFMSNHFEIIDNSDPKNNWKHEISFDNIHLKSMPLFQALFIKVNDMESTDFQPSHRWGVNMAGMDGGKSIVENIFKFAEKKDPAESQLYLHQVNVILDKVFPEGYKETVSKLWTLLKYKGLFDKVPLLKRLNQVKLLCEGVERGDRTAIELLFREGAPLNGIDKDGLNPLHRAVMKGNKEICQLLIDNGAEVNAKDRRGLIPLHLSAMKGYKEICQLLIDRGAEVNAKDHYYGWIPLDLAAMKGHKEIVQLLKQNERAKKPPVTQAGEILVDIMSNVKKRRYYTRFYEELEECIEQEPNQLVKDLLRAKGVALLKSALETPVELGKRKGVLYGWRSSRIKWTEASRVAQEHAKTVFGEKEERGSRKE